jgi:broad specificity phosphatase PhoE
VSRLTLIRHGQARSFERETVLTPVGESQAARLAAYWLHRRIQFDEVYSGTLARQIGTEQVVSDAFRSAGQPWPEARRDRRWNEYDAAGVLGHYVPADPSLAAQAAAYEAARGGPEENRAFQRMLQAAMSKWQEEALQTDGVEPWPAFRDRVSDAITDIMSGPSRREVAVFTSGGPIGFAVHLAMKGPSQSFLEVNWRIRNCSVTEFLFDKVRLTLDSFNAIPHLENVALQTYR